MTARAFIPYRIGLRMDRLDPPGSQSRLGKPRPFGLLLHTGASGLHQRATALTGLSHRRECPNAGRRARPKARNRVVGAERSPFRAVSTVIPFPPEWIRSGWKGIRALSETPEFPLFPDVFCYDSNGNTQI
jgi:hypothetical protein